MIPHVLKLVELNPVPLGELQQKRVHVAFIPPVEKAPLSLRTARTKHKVNRALSIERALNFSFPRTNTSPVIQGRAGEK